ncbi:hypothetical protein [Pseudoduganella sp. HUAS MS19]
MQGKAEALKPILSLISKSEKAQQKVAAGTWQHAMLGANLKALQIASALMDEDQDALARFAPGELKAARQSLASMIGKTAQAQTRFAAGTAQHSLLTNRLSALRRAESAVSEACAHEII